MKKTHILFILLIASASGLPAQEVDYSKLTGPYLGQKEPGLSPEIFAPDIMTSSQGYHSPISFSPDMREAIWRPMLNENVIYYSRIESGRWSTPERIN